MEEKVLQSLMELYKERGVDLTYLTSDPLFNSLNLEQKVRALRTHAQEINLHTSGKMSSNDKKGIAKGMALGAISAAIPAVMGSLSFGSHFKNVPFKSYLKPIALATAGGLGLAALKSSFDVRSNLAQAKSLKGRINELANNNTDINAIKYLSVANGARPISIGPDVKGIVMGRANDMENKYISKIKDNTEYSIWMNNYANHVGDEQPGISTEDAYKKYYEVSKQGPDVGLKPWEEASKNKSTPPTN